MAYVPLSGTDVRIFSDVPFSNDYKNTRWFTSADAQYSYFNAKPRVHVINECNFVGLKEGRPHIRVNKRIDDLYNACYMIFRNTQYSNKWFYCFVTSLEYVNSAVTNLYFEIDVMQTWMFDFKFQPSYIVREHQTMWDANKEPITNTIDEGLNYGTEYDIVAVEQYKPYGDLMFMVCISKSKMHAVAGETFKAGEIAANINGTPQPLSYYIHPFYEDGSSPKVKIGSNEVKVAKPTDFLKNMFSQEHAVKNIVSLYVTDYIGLNIHYDESAKTMSLKDSMFEHAQISDNTHPNVDTIYLKEIKEYEEKTIDTGYKFASFANNEQSKLLMYPYCVTTITDFKGNQIDIKNEYVNGSNLKIQVRGSLGVSNKVTYSVQDYNADSTLSGSQKLTASLQHSLINNNPNDVSIINDYLSAYLQGNKNSLENQKDSILFNGVMSMLGNGIGATASAATGSAVGVASSATGMVSSAGNAVLQIQGMQAKQADIANTPPQLVKMGGNTAYDYGNGYRGVYVIKKQIKEEYRNILSDFFKKYGYKTNLVKMPNLRTRKSYNYVQTKDCNITGNLNNEDLQKIRAIFDSGVTLWHADPVGDYTLNNEVI